MFTGIVTGQGRVVGQEPREGDLRLEIAAPGGYLAGCAIGDSIAVSGACLTAVSIEGDRFAADLSAETIERTTLGGLAEGGLVNLERPLRIGDELGGHLVTGHIDGVAELVERHEDGRAWRLAFAAPDGLERYVVAKGSVCLDGVSLTVNAVDGPRFEVCIIPHTLAVTTLGGLVVGDRVNFEADLIARHAERLLAAQASS